ncbi:MAG: hypothetical protein J6Q63_06365 [Bacteroidales bacterium]|nr:hypothetical protein [Bacteroidales bacterium]
MSKVLDNIICRMSVAMLAMVFLAACEPSFDFNSEFYHDGISAGRVETLGGRDVSNETRNVLLLYSAGFNSISDYLKEDIQDLMKGDLPSDSRMKDVLLVYSHLPSRKNAYSEPNPPVLMRVYQGHAGEVVTDTLVRYHDSVHSADPVQLNAVLTYVKENFPAKTYGMIFSSHATGYLPAGYYTNPGDYIYAPSSAMMGRQGYRKSHRGVPYVEPEHDPSLPMVKSIGQDQVGSYGSYLSYEIQLEEFAEALPMYFDYILFDACLMGGVEVAYELAGKCGLVGFSQAEVLAEGFDYKAIPTHLLNGGTPDPQAVCEDYFQQYDIQSGIYRSATISMVDCSKMEPLAEVCAELFRKYAMEIATLKPEKVQRYYRSDYHWFYDLADIVAKAGAAAEEISALNEAIEYCMVYRAATPEFMGAFTIGTYSGFSMYLPSDGSLELDKYYKTLKWNIATGLVE